MTGLELRIHNCADELNPTYKRIGDYIIQNPHILVRAHIADLAKETGTSQAAIVRFCKRLGFSGFKAVKASIADELLAAVKPKEDEEVFSDIKKLHSVHDTITRVASVNIMAIEQTIKMLDENAVQQAVELLCKAKRIDIFGVGASGLVAEDMHQKLTRIGRYSCSYSDVHNQLTAAASLTKHDVMYLISYSGKTREVIDCLMAAKDRQTPVIALTKIGANPLAKQATIALQICSPEINVRSSAGSSRITQLTVNDILFTGVAGSKPSEVQAILKRSRRYSSKYKV